MVESLTLQLSSQLTNMHHAKMQSRSLATELKNQVLFQLGEKIKNNSNEILKSNKIDLDEYQVSPTYQKAFEDRLTLTDQRIQQMAEGLIAVATLKDPVGEIADNTILTNGLSLKRIRAPLGLIFLIFESRPNVITEAFSLAFKAGNSIILKGGKESKHTSRILYQFIREALAEMQIHPDVFWGLEDSARETTDFLIKQNQWIDVLIPRGGDALIEHVTQNSRIPLIKNDRGLCHLYVHEKADLEMALNILINAKTQRPGVCNSVETLLVDESIANDFLLKMYPVLSNRGVEFFVCDKVNKILVGKPGIFLATPSSFKTEYLDLKLNIKIVEGVKLAIKHIELFGSKHSEVIITSDVKVAKNFEESVDAAVVYWNASSRFTDGGQFGMGGEIGISTQKLQVRGPVGMEALTSCRWIVEGQGQIRL